MILEQPCEYCGKQLRKRAVKNRKGEFCKVIYCNNECYYEHRSVLTKEKYYCDTICNGCGISFRARVKDLEKGNSKYCSDSCRRIHKKANPRNCVRCNCFFTPLRFHNAANKLISNSHGKTCSHECHMAWISENEERKEKISLAFKGEKHPNWQGGVSRGYGSYRGENWKKQRQKALKRDGYKCIVCGMTNDEHMEKYGNGLHVNHIEPFHNINNYKVANRISNLETLCVKHHGLREDRTNIQMNLDLSGDDNHCKIRIGKAKGEKINTAKLVEQEVVDIRKKFEYGLTIQEIHVDYPNVGECCIRDVIKRKTWKHVH